MRHEVIMPALGMAQDTGLIVSWGKMPGEAVSVDDVLLEVETDKSTMEVPAGHDGYLAEIHAQAGEDVPVGTTIAIITAEKPAEMVNRRYDDTDAPEPVAAADPMPIDKTGKPEATPQPAAAPTTGGRILASPKARRLAQIEGLDLARLVEAGYRQPFHVKDLETARALPGKTAMLSASANARRLTAKVPAEGFATFCDWINQETGTPADGAGVIAAMAAAALRAGGHNAECTVAVERLGRALFYSNRAGSWLDAERMETAATPALVVRDLRESALTGIALGAEEVPVISLTGAGEEIAITLECRPEQLGAGAALTLITEFAGRLGDPLRHLL